MDINLLGKKNEEEKVTKPEPAFHIPPQQPRERREKEVPIVPPQPVANESVDLSQSVRRRRKKMKLAGVIVFVVAAVAGASYGVSKIPRRTAAPIPQTPVVTQPVTTPTTIPQPTVPSQTTPGSPGNTPLAPLRGALVKFSGSTELYLIENNGELRLVDQTTTIFENGQRVNQVNKTLLYTLPDKWQSTRRGKTIVTGQVDFDPRVLTINELLPFIQ